jgi:CHAT domain-containing protein/tetratricopeptide (TPR) repeat protein
MLGLGLWTAAACAPPDHPLGRGAVERLTLDPGAAKRYVVRLDAGDLLRVSVEQRGLDVVIRVRDRPDVDLPYGDRVHEELWWVAERAGPLRFEIASLGGGGHGTVRVVALGPASGAQRRQAEAFWQVEEARASLSSEPAAGLPVLEAAASVWRAAGMPRLAALARSDSGQALLRLGRPGPALAAFEEAAALARTAEGPLRGRIIEWRGRANEAAARLAPAARDYRLAAALAREGGDAYGEALATNDLALIDESRGELEAAIGGYMHAGALFAAVDARRAELRARLNLATCYMKLGAMGRARPLLAEALEATTGRSGFEDLGAGALRDLGWWHRLDGDLPAARRLLLEANALAGEDIGTLDRLGTVHADLGDFARARFYYDAVERRLGDNPLWRASLDANRCRLEGLAGNHDQGLALCRRALAVFDALGVSSEAAYVRYLTGTLYKALGRLDEAHAETERAVLAVEEGRLRAGSPEMRSVFQSSHLAPYRSLVAIEMALHRRHPTAGWDARALRVSELTRARQLRDLLAAEQSRVPPAETAGWPVELPRIQAQLDAETSLLVYHLGAGTSYLWLVDRTGVRSFHLPGEEVVAPAAEAWYALLAEAHRRGGRGAGLERRRAERLSRMLVLPIVEEVAGRRLVIVADGVLQRLPFAALPIPGGDGRPLVAAHEIASLPSASVLALLRRETAGRTPAPGLIAALADPVFDAEDERLGASAEGRRGAAYPRLAATGTEARDLLALAPDASNLLLEGFEARLDRVIEGQLAGFRIVHFATHTQTTASRDRPYGLLLSLVDSAGRPLEGLLGLRDLYHLRLPAELVTLSACGTALGDLEAEGLMGLTHGFMRAGTPRVVVSLWAVEDRATRELMRRFYRALLHDRAGPAEALRRAQLSMWSEGRAPHQWAAFVLHGDWRPFLIDPTSLDASPAATKTPPPGP